MSSCMGPGRCRVVWPESMLSRLSWARADVESSKLRLMLREQARADVKPSGSGLMSSRPGLGLC